MIDKEKLKSFCMNRLENVRAATLDCTADFDSGVAEGKISALQMMLSEIESGHLNANSPWIHLGKQDLKRIFERDGRIRRRDGNGIEYLIQQLSYNVLGAQTTLSQADAPSTRLIIPTDELIAEFEEVK